MHNTDTRSFDVRELTRVEGEGALHIQVEGDHITDLRFQIFEPPRFYEAFLRGRHCLEVPDITARICGICPVAYQTSSANAIEQALGMTPGPEILDLRRMLYLGEYVESHALHVYLLHAPDFLGYPSGIDLARDHGDIVGRGLRLKRIGNDVMDLIGGREIHPINPRVGGFWKAPSVAAINGLRPDLEWALEAAVDTLGWTASFEFPDFDPGYEFVALHDPDEYAVIDGRFRSSGGIDVAVEEWPDVFVEEHVPWSHALHARIRERGSYHVGPMARFNINFEQLHPTARSEAVRHGVTPPEPNPFRSIAVRSVETVHAAASLLDLIDGYMPPDPSFVAIPEGTGGIGHGASEAPRGVLYHRYEIGSDGLVADATIVPPTSQNQLRMEDDLRVLVPSILDRPDDEIQHLVEQAVRNYDPCISCATHFIELEIDRR